MPPTSFLTTGIDSLTPDTETALLEDYLERLSDAAPDYEMDQLIEDCRHAALLIYFRHLRALSSVSDLPVNSPLNRMRFKAFERSVAAMELQECLDLLTLNRIAVRQLSRST